MATGTIGRSARPAATPELPPAPRAGRIPRNRWVVAGAGVVVALLGFGSTVAIAQIIGAAPPGTTRIVVAARDIQARTVIEPADLTLAPFNTTTLPPGAFRAPADVKGKAAQVNVARGQPLLGSVLVNSVDELQETGPAYLPIPTGFVAVTLPTSEQQGVAGYIQAGDYITIVASVNTALFNGQSRPVTKTAYNNVHVIRVGPWSPANGRTQAPGSLTVVISQCDAEYLNWLLNNAALRYTLESHKDYQPTDVTPNANCPSVTSPGGVGPAQVDGRFGFTKV